MSFIFGSSPKVQNLGPQQSTSPQQQAATGSAVQGLEQMLPIQPWNNIVAEPLDPQQVHLANQAAGYGYGLPDPSTSAPMLQGAMGTNLGLQGFQAGQAAGAGYDPSGLQTPTVDPSRFQAGQVQTQWQTPTIDSTQAFQKGVVDPLTQNWESQILPALKAAGGQSAGGIYSSDTSRQEQLAATGLNTQLAGAGANLAYQAAAANQAAQQATNQLGAQTQIANQGAGLTAQQQQLSALQGNQSAQQYMNQLLAQVGLTNAQQQQQNQQFNVGAGLAGAGVRQQAAQAAPGIATGQYAPASAAAQTLQSLWPTLSAPQQQQDLTIQRLMQNYYLPQQLSIQGYGTLGQIGTANTQQPGIAVTGGSTGILPGLLGAAGQFAGSPAGSAAIASLFPSDRAVKTNVEAVGNNRRLGLPVYAFRYKSDPEGVRRVGYMAQDVEEDYPEAVAQDADGVKYVSYGALALREAFPEVRAL